MTKAKPVAVVGAGPAGSVTALSLARLGHRVVLLERTTEDRPAGEGAAALEGRVGEALPPDVKPLLQRLGLWEAFTNDGHLEAYGTRSSWGSSIPTDKSFISNPYGHGWHVDRARFDSWLMAVAAEAGVEVRRGVEVIDVSISGGEPRLHCVDGDRAWTVQASTAVDASGRVSIVARKLGARRHCCDRLLAFVTRWEAGPTDDDARLLVEAAVDGWWYSAPVPGRRRVVVYHTDVDCPSARRARTRSGYMSLLQETKEIRAVMAGAEHMSSPRPSVRAAGTSWLQPTSGPGWLAVGDAAAAFDPLSAQGMTVAIEGGGRAAEVVHGVDRDYDGWLKSLLATYFAQRTRIYRAEQRWPTKAFWARRHIDTVVAHA